jgi:hypothetical protein
MATIAVDEDQFVEMFAELKPRLNELQWRLLLGAHARALGYGGRKRIAQLTGAHPDTVARGARELEEGIPEEMEGRVRQAGAGRPLAEDADPQLLPALRALVEPGTRGDPMRPLLWTTESTQTLADRLSADGHPVSADTVGRLLKDKLAYSLQGNSKTIEGSQHPDRDAQFRYVNDLVVWCLAAGIPVISIDCKKKELVGNFKNGGREWRPKGDPRRVSDHDFMDKKLGKVAPYGVYDVGANTGWVNAGTDHETSAFAVESVRRWWTSAGSATYPGARQLLITADCGGSNGYNRKLWKVELAQLATELDLEITVVHLPPGASKWNKIEHRLFSAISCNWRGRPLVSHEVILESIRATTTRTGLRVHAELDTGSYPTGIEVPDKVIRQLKEQVIAGHEFHGDWNYTVKPGYRASPDIDTLITTRPKVS